MTSQCGLNFFFQPCIDLGHPGIFREVCIHPVDEPQKFGIVFTRPDGTLEKLVEKPPLTGRQLANIGVYLFPHWAIDIDLPLSPRGEYEITDAVSSVAAKEPFHVVPAKFWLPIGTVDAWQAAQTADLSPVHRG